MARTYPDQPLGSTNASPLNVFRFGALFARDDFEDDLLPLMQRLKTVTKDRRVVDKDILPPILSNKPQALFIVPPFDFAFSHIPSLLKL